MNSNTLAAADNITTLPSTSKPQTSKDLIAANVQLLIEQLEAGHSEGLTAYLTAMGRFHNYSFGNILEIARQRPDATRVAGLHAWNQLGRKVRKGEKGIRILAPMIGNRKKKDSGNSEDPATPKTVLVASVPPTCSMCPRPTAKRSPHSQSGPEERLESSANG